MSIAQRLVNLSDGLSAEGILSAAKGGTGTTTGAGSSTPTISTINYGGDDTATNPAGGQTITLTGTNFASGARVLINTTQASVVTVVSSTQITFTAPALAAGSYILYVVNLDGSTAIAVPGIQVSGTPAWTTAAGSLGTGYETAQVSTTVSATSDSAVSYSVISGTLPDGVTVNSSGSISGTSPLVGGSTTYTFTVRATDGELQDTDRQFSLTINPDVVVWSSPTSGATLTGTPGVAYTSNLAAASAAGQTVSYTADSLPAGLTLSGSTISGTPTTPGTSATTLTATSAVTNKTAEVAISWTINIASDTYFKYTTLLLNSETTAQPFLADASVNNFQLTAYGDTKPNNFNPYTPGYYSVQFNGTSDYLTIPHSPTLVFGSSGYSVECWVYMTSLTAGQYIWNKNGVSGSKYPSIGLQWDGTKFRLVYGNSTGLSTVEYVNFNTIPNILNNWVHIAIQINGSTIQSWVNGAYQPDTYTLQNLPVDNGQPFYIGGQSGATSNATGLFSGYISNLRVIMGGFYYDGSTAARTLPPVPASPVQAVSINSYYVASGETQLVACNSARFIDLSSNNHTVNRVGAPKVSGFDPYTPNASYSTRGSTYFNGSSYLSSTIPTTTIGTNDFTVECWVYPTAAYGSLSRMFLFGIPGAGYLTFFINSSGQIVYGPSGSDRITTSSTVPLNTWTHIAISRNSGTSNVYINGVSGGSAADPSNFSSANNFYLGQDGSGNYFTGYINDFRLVIGSAVYTTAFTPPTQPLTAVANTSLLILQTNQPHTNNTFLDNSSNALAITRSGNSTQGSFSPYGASWSNYFDGSGDYVTAPAGTGAMGTGDFTIELWAYHTTSDAWAGYYYQGEGGSGGGINFRKTNTNKLSLAHDSVVDVFTTTASVPINQWTHLAVTRSSGTVRAFIDGVLATTTTYTGNFTGTSGQQTIGSITSGLYFMAGYISNFRVVKGTALYTSAFTPPTQPLTAVSGTELLTCQSPNFVDNSLKAGVINKAGDTRVEKFSPFSLVTQTPTTHSVYFDGSGDYLSIAGSSALDFGTADFTVEAWINRTAYTSGRQNPIIGRSDSGFTLGVLQNQASNGTVDQGKIGITVSDTVIVMGTTVTQANQWYHVAVSRSSGTLRIFVNGVLEGSATYSTAVSLQSSQIGWNGYDYSWDTRYFNGYISNVRAIKGTAIYTSTFTTLTTALTAIAGTSLLTCQDATIRDNSSNNFTLTAAGNTAPRRQNPFGHTTSSAQDYTPAVFGGSAFFDGSDYLEFPLTNNTFKFGTGEFTVEFWVYPTSAPNNNWSPFFTIGGSGGGQEIRISQNQNGGGYGYLVPNNALNADIYPYFGNFNIFEWHHLALVRSGTTVSFYRNGVLVGTTTSASFNFTNTSVGRIGHPQPAYPDGSYIGYMSDVRVANKALYTANFAPPSAPLQAVSGTVLLLNMDKSAVQDKSGKVVLETVGDAKVSTAIKKYGTSSMYFDGSDYLSANSMGSGDLGTGDFTIEYWMNSSASGSYSGPVGTQEAAGAGTAGVWRCLNRFNNANGIYFAYTNGSTFTDITFTTTNYNDNTWHHVAYVRSATLLRAYVDGVQVGSAVSATQSLTSGKKLTLGYNPQDNAYYTGYVDDLRITKGYARYTANFTPPTQALLTK